MPGKIMLITVYGCAVPALVVFHFFVRAIGGQTLSLMTFLGNTWDGVVGDRPDFLDFLVCLFFAVVDVLLLATVGLAVAYFTKGA